MNHLTLNDIYMFLVFILRTRRAEVDAIPQGASGALILDPTLAEIEALPTEDFGGTPNADALSEVDARHDGNGLALHYLALAIEASFRTSAKAKEAAALIKTQYVPSRGHLRAAYATEAGRAKAREKRLPADKDLLDAIPVEGGTAFDWATAYVQDGLEIDRLLTGRADRKGERTDASALRTHAISEIASFRDIIAKALRRTSDGGRAIDRRLFNYLDLLIAIRSKGSTEPTPPPPPDDPAEPTPEG